MKIEKYLNKLDLVWWFFSAIFLALFVLWLAIPKFSQITSLWEESKIQNQKLIFLRTKIANLEKLGNDKIDNNLQVSELALPSKKDPGLIFYILQNLAASNDFSSSDLSFNFDDLFNTIGKTQASEVRLSFVLTGDAKNLPNYFALLQNLLPIVSINSLNFSQSRDEKTNNYLAQVALDVSFPYYYQSITSSQTLEVKKLSALQKKILVSLKKRFVLDEGKGEIKRFEEL